MADPTTAPPPDVAALMDRYGVPSSAGFGSAVFHEPLAADRALEDAAKAAYRRFLGDQWDNAGADVWMAPWRKVHERAHGAARDVVAELGAIADPEARLSAPMILEAVDDAEAARAALVAVYDAAAITEFQVFNVGDGGAMSGLVVAGCDRGAGTSTCLVFLMD